MEQGELMVLLERTWQHDLAAVTDALRASDPTWDSCWFELADGLGVLHGAGLYVNRAVGCGIDPDVGTADLAAAIDELQRRSAQRGVPAQVDVSELSADRLEPLLVGRDFAVDDQTAALCVRAADVPEPSDDLVIELVEPRGSAALASWQRAARAGWGHVAPDAERASDAFAAAWAQTDGSTLLIAHDRATGVVVGGSSLTIRGEVATLGGMSTLPDHRGRGVQSAMIRHRAALARKQGCTWVSSTAAPESGSLRNLVRHGFSELHTTTTWTSTL